MSKLPVVSSRELIKILIKRGFQYSSTNGSHQVFKKDNRLVTVPHRKEIGKGLFRKILNEAGISREDFIRDWNG